MSDQEIIIEKRRAPRTRTYLGAHIIIDKTSLFSCVIKSRSDSGYGLKLGSTQGVPDRFWLLDDKSGDRHFCRVAWRKRNALGVEIVTPEASDPPLPDFATYASRLNG
jgi:hypothetical protein